MESHMLSHQLRKIDTKSEHIPFEGPPIREPLRKRNEGTQPPGASGSDTLNEPTPMEQDQEEVKL
ncbi:unnamed protein product, partial [Cochlearia groenlandica]